LYECMPYPILHFWSQGFTSTQILTVLLPTFCYEESCFFFKLLQRAIVPRPGFCIDVMPSFPQLNSTQIMFLKTHFKLTEIIYVNLLSCKYSLYCISPNCSDCIFECVVHSKKFVQASSFFLPPTTAQ
jgi:hypothetical protein